MATETKRLVLADNVRLRGVNTPPNQVAAQLARSLRDVESRGDGAIGVAAIAWQEASARASRTLLRCEGQPVFMELGSSRVIPADIWRQPFVKDWFLGNNPDGKPMVDHAVGASMHVSRQVIAEPLIADYVEQAVAHNDFKALELVSIGPTQMNMRVPRAQRPSTIDEFWDFWTTADEVRNWDRIFGYLEKEGGKWNGNIDEMSLRWATVQTGNAKLGADYAMGTGLWANSGGIRSKMYTVRSLL